MYFHKQLISSLSLLSTSGLYTPKSMVRYQNTFVTKYFNTNEEGNHKFRTLTGCCCCPCSLASNQNSYQIQINQLLFMNDFRLFISSHLYTERDLYEMLLLLNCFYLMLILWCHHIFKNRMNGINLNSKII